ncbi:MAG: chain length-determining protein [Gammaproteobacteria bacterium]|nr:chain length-determining protein [Gammaproteobacteria bacterium]
MHDLMAQLLSYLKGIWQHRWYVIIVAWVVSVAGWAVVYTLPDRYDASARVYVDTQTILKPLLSGMVVQLNVDQQVAMMSRTLLSRPNLEKLVSMADLDITAKTASDKESLIDGLARQIGIQSAGRDNLYVINYGHRKPEVAKRVVQALLTIFVEDSLGDKRKDADSARRFIDEQIKAYEQKLIVAENALRDFKRQNMGMMPGEGKDYFGRMAGASGDVNQAKLDLREAESARDAIKNQLADVESTAIVDEPPPAPANPELDARIQELTKNLDALRLRYTEQHPDVVTTKRIIEQLETQKKEEAKLNPPSSGTHSQGQTTNPLYQQLSIALSEAEANVASMQARVKEYENRYEQLKAAADRVPQVEADLTQLNRDYSVHKENYEKLLARRESAQISGELDATKGAVDFRIVDPPRVPITPSGPNRPQLMSLVLLGGLIGGLALAFFVSQVRPTFNDPRTLREVTGLPLLGMVSMTWTRQQSRKYKNRLIAFILSFLSLLGAYAAIMAMLFLTAKLA